MITVFARWTVPTESVRSLMSPVRSTAVMSSSIISAPNFSAWARMFSMRTGPSTPSGKPGKFSTSVVVVREPPTKMELPNSRGCSCARAV
jgi:hypothetical protein